MDYYLMRFMGCCDFGLDVLKDILKLDVCGIFALHLFSPVYFKQCTRGNHNTLLQSNLIYPNNCFQLRVVIVTHYGMAGLKVGGTLFTKKLTSLNKTMLVSNIQYIWLFAPTMQMICRVNHRSIKCTCILFFQLERLWVAGNMFLLLKDILKMHTFVGCFGQTLFLTNFGLQCGMGNHISWWQSNLIYSNICFQLGTTVIIYRMLRLKVAGTRVACINKIVNINGH